MKLFAIENGIVKPTRESLMVYPFAEIWNRDKSEKKDMASREAAYIEFYCSYLDTNPYAGYVDDKIRKQKIIEGVFKDLPDWQPDQLILDGVAVYEDHRDNSSPTIKLYKAGLEGMKRVREYLETVDMKKVTKSGVLVNKPSDVINALTKLSALMSSFAELKKKVQQEALESAKTRSNRKVNHFER